MKLGELRELAKALPVFGSAQTQAQLDEYLEELGFDPNRLYHELEMTSPFVDTHRDTSFSNEQVQLHSHAFFELLYCRNSCGAEYLVGSERYRLQQGDIVFVPPGVSHRPLLPEHMTEPYKRYVLWLSVDFIEQYAQLLPHNLRETPSYVGMLRTAGTKWDHLGDLFRSGVLEAEQQADGWEAAVIGNTMVLLTQLKRATEDHTARSLKAETPDLLDRITAYVESNYTNPIAISDLAGQFYVSNSTISHLFKQKMGVSFYRYVTQRRLIAAKTLIAQGLTLEEVGNHSGFADYSTFYRAFKQEYGISPRHYRSLLDQHSKNAP